MEKRCTPDEVDGFINNSMVDAGVTIKFNFFSSATHKEPVSGYFKDFNVNDAAPGIRLKNGCFYDAERIESGSLEVV